MRGLCLFQHNVLAGVEVGSFMTVSMLNERRCDRVIGPSRHLVNERERPPTAFRPTQRRGGSISSWYLVWPCISRGLMGDDVVAISRVGTRCCFPSTVTRTGRLRSGAEVAAAAEEEMLLATISTRCISRRTSHSWLHFCSTSSAQLHETCVSNAVYF